MRKGNLFFLILLVSIFAFSLYALEKQGTPLVKKEKPLVSSEKGIGECCKEGNVPLTTAQPQKEKGLQAKGEKKTAKPEVGKEPSSQEVKKRKKGLVIPSEATRGEAREEKDIASEEEEEEETEEYEEYEEGLGPEEEEGDDFSTY